MDPFMIFWAILIGIILGVIIGVFLIHRTAVLPLHTRIDELTREIQLLSTATKTIIADKETALKDYPYPLENLRLIQTPIDGIQFNKDSIIFIKFIRPNTKLTKSQQHIKRLVQQGNIHWFEFKIK